MVGSCALNTMPSCLLTLAGVLAMDSSTYGGPELQPCGNNISTCCLPDEKCGTNLLCSTTRAFSRQYCANKNWQGCSQLSPETTNHGLEIKACGGNIFCYHQPMDTCCTNGPLFFVNPETGWVANGSERDTTASPTYWQPSYTSELALLSSSTPQPTATSIEIMSTFTSLTLHPSPTDTMKSSSQNSSDLSPVAGAGIGVGSAIVVVSLVAFTWLLVRYRRSSHRRSCDEFGTRNVSWKHTRSNRSTPQELDEGGARQEMQ
ncbi:hypothetical protein HBI56_217700 [Parastagonospora nodorum]|nr:hypothetical protein HBH46_207320 [Parastagonospora nodorum]KAH4401477.1 hypothetical protein HBH92_223010 [Parastagonospora nodorum]KAH4430894.1 hypothetical protein HBH91_233320 [Parastagonospora nodorum]KAH4438896.1 hypothetical protein HBH93_088250 [Parastagonospora nodorum]KAH4486405.1 hypothetical protein HBH89_207970 [Parastagonospora nodorum]